MEQVMHIHTSLTTHTQSGLNTHTHTQGHSSTLFTDLRASRKLWFTAFGTAATIDTVLVVFRVDPF